MLTEKWSIGILLKKIGSQCNTEAIVNEEIELVPFYSYQILFLDEDGKYRVFTTTDIHYTVLKKGDQITYTKMSTDKVK